MLLNARILHTLRVASHSQHSSRLVFKTLSTCTIMAKANDDKSSSGGITNWASNDGSFKRQTSSFRNHISADSGAEFPPEKGRYMLYISHACPWAHRTMIVRSLKGLDSIIDVTAVHWHMGDKGWRFVTPDEVEDQDVKGRFVRPDPVHDGYTHLRDIYFEQDPKYEGRFTVPTLYDVKAKKIVNNESADIIRMLYHSFDSVVEDKYKSVDLLPKDLEKQIDQVNDWTYNDINNGVYKSGFATKASAYESAVTTLFSSLDKVEAHLSQHAKPYYWGNAITESDVRLYTTIVRFDPVYVQHFKCNVRDIRSGYPAIHRWLRNLYWNVPAFHETTDFNHIKKHYTRSHTQINKYSITPVGPLPNILPLDKEVAAAEYAVEKH